ncbi:MAG TPA: YHS domain-containing protein, partial [Desulfomicrobiaceae bacterium]|nr:YHS domain-containing protein [Desulfomicrobiaceae bacterium]
TSAYAAEQTKCPVMGYTINKEIYADYEGKRVYFCCGSCISEFKKNPEKYIKKLEEQGVDLKKVPDEKK